MLRSPHTILCLMNSTCGSLTGNAGLYILGLLANHWLVSTRSNIAGVPTRDRTQSICTSAVASINGLAPLANLVVASLQQLVAAANEPIVITHRSRIRSSFVKLHHPRATGPCKISFKTSHTLKPHHHHLKNPLAHDSISLAQLRTFPTELTLSSRFIRPVRSSVHRLRTLPSCPSERHAACRHLTGGVEYAALAPRRPRAIRV